MTEIRPARAADALCLAGQLAQLGYPSELDAVTSRLAGILKSATQQVAAADFAVCRSGAMTCAELAADADIVLARHVLSAVAERRRLVS
jgi:hypothetical protein